MESKISPLPWNISEDGINCSKNWQVVDKEVTSAKDMEAIVSAVNNTWGKGIDPACVPEVVNALVELVAALDNQKENVIGDIVSKNRVERYIREAKAILKEANK